MKQKRYISYVGNGDAVGEEVPESELSQSAEEHVSTVRSPIFSNPHRIVIAGVDVTNLTMSVNVDNEFAKHASSFWSSRIRMEIIGDDDMILKEVWKWKSAGTVDIRVTGTDYRGILQSYSLCDAPGRHRTITLDWSCTQ